MMMMMTMMINLVPRAFPFKKNFLREKPWGRGWMMMVIIMIMRKINLVPRSPTAKGKGKQSEIWVRD